MFNRLATLVCLFVALPLMACVPVRAEETPTVSSSAPAAHPYEYKAFVPKPGAVFKVEGGQQFEVCRAIKDYLNDTFADKMLTTDWSRNPKYPKLTFPKWTPVPITEHMDVIETMYLSDAPPEYRKKFESEMQRDLASPSAVLQTSEIDVNHDGSKDHVFRFGILSSYSHLVGWRFFAQYKLLEGSSETPEKNLVGGGVTVPMFYDGRSFLASIDSVDNPNRQYDGIDLWDTNAIGADCDIRRRNP